VESPRALSKRLMTSFHELSAVMPKISLFVILVCYSIF
jgi:hypothetical protein